MTEYQFTKDWFNWAPEVWTQLIPHLPERRAFLEIGSFEGRSTVWIVENMMNPGDWIDCVDTWKGGEEHAEEDMLSVEERFHHNVDVVLGGGTMSERASYDTGSYFTRFASDGPDRTNNRIYKYKSTSAEFLGRKLASNLAHLKPEYVPMYDFIYIDGSHIAKDVLTDACMAWPLLKPKGMMVFDDYMWGNPRDILHRPKPAIDAFCNLFAEEAEIIHVGYQLVVRKKGE
jgi:hypothetical protein